MMSAEYLISLPVLLVSIVILVAVVIVLLQCVCGKRKDNSEPKLTQAQSKHASTYLDADTLCKMSEQTDISGGGGHVDVETSVTPLNISIGSHNGTLHSRGNSVDLNKADRRSGTSSGSSPRPTTLSRELPDIPIHKTKENRHHSALPEIPAYTESHQKGDHSTLPDVPNLRNPVNSLEPQRKGAHSHSQLPDIPVTTHGSLSSSPVVHRENENIAKSIDSSKTMREKLSGMDDYDHIEEATKKKVRPRSDYDHVVIEGGEKKILLSKDKLNENDYAEVKNNEMYEQVTQDVMVIPVSKPSCTSHNKSLQKSPTHKVTETNSFEDPYNKIKGDDTPYNRIKDDPPYNKIKESDQPYNKIKDDPYNKIKVDDPYNTVKDDLDDLDPYNTVNDGSGSARSSGRKKPRSTSFKGQVYDPYAMVLDEERNVSNQTDPYARVGDTESELDDPYNKVVEDVDVNESIRNINPIPEYGDDDYATVNKAGEVEYAKVNKSGKLNNCDSGQMTHTPPSPREEIIQDEYATVVKVRKLSAGNSSAGASISTGEGITNTVNVISQGSIVPTEIANTSGASALTPPEPPRDYDESRDTDGDHYNIVSLVSREVSTNSQGSKKEPPYNKLSVRESLASMNARAASNTYEYVSEVDNLYATVDGSSGDGTVRRHAQPDVTDTQTTDYKTKINAPAPPSLDSLHETAKQHQDEFRRKTDKKQDHYNIENGHQNHVIGHRRSSSGQGHSRTSSDHGHFRTPSGEVMSSSFEGRVPIATAENVDLEYDPNYQSVQESKISDNISEFDPNYETVEEAQAKLRYEEINGARPKDKLVRPHIYEDPDTKSKYEVVNGETLTEDGKIRAHVYEEVTVTNEARRTRQRVLNQHTYEEVTDVKDKDKKSNQSQGQHKKKGHERNSSGDWLLFGKKKSGDDKSKVNKKKLDGREEKRKSNDIGKK